jgi:hypothetical protein
MGTLRLLLKWRDITAAPTSAVHRSERRLLIQVIDAPESGIVDDAAFPVTPRNEESRRLD